MSDAIILLGYAAAAMTTGSFIPQVLQILKTRDTSSISLGMYCIFVSGVSCWLIYGLMIHDMPLLIANGITLLLSGIILALKIRDKSRMSRIQNQRKTVIPVT